MHQSKSSLLAFLLLSTGIEAQEATTTQPVATPTREGLASEFQALQDSLASLDARLRVQERLHEIAVEEAAAKAKTAPAIQAGASGLLLRSADTAWSVRFRGLVRTAASWDLDDENDKTLDQIQSHTVRLGLEGNLARRIGYRIQADFSKGSVGLQDAYTDLALAPWFQLRLGKFQVPLGWERFQSPGDLPFLDRALPSTVAPNRDVGAQLSGELAKGRFTYALAYVNGGFDGSNLNGDVNDDKDVYLRLWTVPFKGANSPWLAGLGLGAAASAGYHEGAPSSYKSAGSNTWFSWNSADSAKGTGWRIAPQASWTAGPFWAWGEWTHSVETLRKAQTSSSTDSVGTGSSNKGVVYRYTKTVAGAPSLELGTTSWQAGLSWVVTGEDASEKGVKPRHPFDGSENGGFGALELSGRISGLSLDDDVFPVYADTLKSARSALSWAVSANWHLVRGTRLQASFERTVFDGGATLKTTNSAGKSVSVVRDRKPENLLSIVASTSF